MTTRPKIYHTDNKIQHIKDFIQQFQERKKNSNFLLKPILFLFGASGTGKQTVVTTLLDKYGFQVKYLSTSQDVPKDEIDSVDNLLKETLFYRALNISARLQWEKYAIVLKEIDSINILKSPSMVSILRQYQAEVDRREPLNPIIFLLDSTIYYEGILKQFLCQTFITSCCMVQEFPPLSAKQTENFLKDSSTKQGIFLNEQVRKEIADQVNGDIRSALNQLTLHSYDQSSKKIFNGKDNCVGLYHSLGKILYNKRKDKKTGDMFEIFFIQQTRDELSRNQREITQKLQCQQNIIRAFLFENYLPFFFEIDEVERYTQILQDCDILQSSLIWNEKSIALKEDLDNFITDLYVQGYMENNNSIQKVKKRFMYFSKPSLFIKRREQRTNQTSLAKALSHVPSKERGRCLKLVLKIQHREHQQTQLIQSEVRSKGKSQLSVNAVIVQDFDEDELSIQQLTQNQKQLDTAKQVSQIPQADVLQDIVVQKNCKNLIPQRKKTLKLSEEMLQQLKELIG